MQFTSTKQLFATGTTVLLIVIAAIYISWNPPQSRDFSEKDVAEIKSLLKDLNPSTYRIVLPVIRNNKQVGSETLGTLSIARVERVASSKRIRYTGMGNLQMVMDPNEAGMSGGESAAGGGGNTGSGGNEKSGPGSHNKNTPGRGKYLDVMSRINLVTKSYEQSKYVFIK